MLWRLWYKLNVIIGWPILLLFDIGLAVLGYGYAEQRRQSRRALKNIWRGREHNDDGAASEQEPQR